MTIVHILIWILNRCSSMSKWISQFRFFLKWFGNLNNILPAIFDYDFERHLVYKDIGDYGTP